MTCLNTGTESVESPPPPHPNPFPLPLPFSQHKGAVFVLGPHGNVNDCVFVDPSGAMLLISK